MFTCRLQTNLRHSLHNLRHSLHNLRHSFDDSFRWGNKKFRVRSPLTKMHDSVGKAFELAATQVHVILSSRVLSSRLIGALKLLHA